MRRILALSIFLLPVLPGIAQDVTGTWGGHFSYEGGCGPSRQLIYLHLKQGADSAITGYSTTCLSSPVLTINGRASGPVSYDTLVCHVRGWVKAGRVEITETGGIDPNSETANMGLQRMILKYRSGQNKITLKGRWEEVEASLCGRGDISFKKLDE